MDLTFDNHRVDDVPAIINGDKSPNFNFGCFWIDIYHTNVGTERKGQIGRIIIMGCLQTCLQSLGMIGIGGKGNVLDCLRLFRRTFNVEFTNFPLEIFFTDFEQVGSNLSGLIPNLVCRFCSRSSCSRSTPTGVGSQSVRSRIGVTLLDLDMSSRNSQFCSKDLGVGCFVPLALRFGPETGNRLASGMDSQLTAVEHLDSQNIEILGRSCSYDFSKSG